MPRRPRINAPGMIYHIFQRGNNKEYIFDRDEDKLSILYLLEEHTQKADFELLAFVIMSNHYHLILQLKEAPMHIFMHRIISNFAKSYNKRQRRSGHVFEGRYNSIPVKDEPHLLDLLRYVHQNPVRAGICKQVHEYAWSSDQFYRKQDYEGLINTALILDSLSDKRPGAIEMYIDFMNEPVNKGTDFFESVPLIGDKKKHLDDLLFESCQDEAICRAIRSGSSVPDLMPYKKQFARAARKVGYPMAAIGEHISISQSSISRLLKS
ncbi:MAG: transposase [Eubacteriales bacterium]|nr:transposase [Eubacteriales bacterium]